MSSKDYAAQYRANNRQKFRDHAKARRLNFKFTVLNHYSTSCAVCSFNDYRALQIDHIKDNGADERKSLGGKSFSGWRFYEWLVKQGFPAGYQTLCANCNNIKQWERTNS